MKPGQSNAKGGEFERKICRALTAWIDPTRKNGKPELFWRSATSGAKATQDRKSGRKANQGGDLIAVADEVLGTDHFWVTKVFSFECKDRHDYGNLDLLFTGRGDFLKWWKKAKGDAEHKIPLLIFKRYRQETLIAYPAYSIMSTSLPCMIFWSKELEEQKGVAIGLFTDWLAANKADRLKSKLAKTIMRVDRGFKPPRKYLGKAGK